MFLDSLDDVIADGVVNDAGGEVMVMASLVVVKYCVGSDCKTEEWESCCYCCCSCNRCQC